MGLKTFTLDFKGVSKKSSLRSDFRFANYFQTEVPYKHSFFRDYIVKISNGKDIAKENYILLQDSDIIYPTVNNIKLTGLVLDEVTAIDSEFWGGYYLCDNDIVLTRSGTVGLTKCWDKKEINDSLGKEVESIPSGYLIVVTPNQEKVNPKFVEHLFNSSLFSEYFFVFGVGKSQKNIAQGDVQSIPFPFIPKTKQNHIVAQIEPIEKIIKKLKSQIKEPKELINKVFAREFKFDLEQFEALKKIKISDLEFPAFANNKDLRNSVKFHRKAGQFVLNDLKKRTRKKIKDFISEAIVLGKGISPTQYDDDNGNCYYLSMATIKNWKFESEKARLVSRKFAYDNQNKTVLRDDILLARSGEGTIGKVAIIEDEELRGVFADFTMRIRLKDYNCSFAYYYFRTDYFQYLVEINKKGLGNNTNIFPSQIQELPLLEISLDEQQAIVDEIKTELNAQEKITTTIDKERMKIDKIIENEIKNSEQGAAH